MREKSRKVSQDCIPLLLPFSSGQPLRLAADGFMVLLLGMRWYAVGQRREKK